PHHQSPTARLAKAFTLLAALEHEDPVLLRAACRGLKLLETLTLKPAGVAFNIPFRIIAQDLSNSSLSIRSR
ncbi:MAG: hypothetical protein QXF68_08575, partial [Thermofilaceae archaeon]